jgi:phosphatidylglycerophosphate synthase
MKILPSAFGRRFLAALSPLMRVFLLPGWHPNVFTTLGCLVWIAAGAAFFMGRLQLGGALVLLGGFVDTLDGYVARERGLVSAFGAFYDSVLDRVSEVAVFVGLMSLYSGTGPRTIGEPWMIYVIGLALGGSLMVSYTRARAEALGVSCSVGIMQRAERILLLGGATLLFGSWQNGVVLTWVLIAMAVLTNLTAFYRIHWVWRRTRGPGAPTPAGDAVSARETIHT